MTTARSGTTVSFDLYAGRPAVAGRRGRIGAPVQGGRSGLGAIRFLVYDNRAHMGSYQVALDSPGRPADIVATRVYRYKNRLWRQRGAGTCQECRRFRPPGWSDGQNEAWVFADVDPDCVAWPELQRRGVGAAGRYARPRRSDQTPFPAPIGTSSPPAAPASLPATGRFPTAPSRLWRPITTFALAPHLNAALDYQFVANPAYNRRPRSRIYFCHTVALESLSSAWYFVLRSRRAIPRARRPCHVAWASRPCQTRLIQKKAVLSPPRPDFSLPSKNAFLSLPLRLSLGSSAWWIVR